MAEEVSRTKLITGIIGTIDYGNLISTVVNLSEDMRRAQEVKSRIKSFFDSNYLKQAQFLSSLALKSTTEMMQNAYNELMWRYPWLLEQSFNQSMQSAGGFKLTSQMMGLEAKLYTNLTGLDTFEDMVFGIPLNILRKRAEYFWNAGLGWDWPNEKTLILLAKMGLSKWETLTDFYRQKYGVSEYYAKIMTDLARWQIGQFSLRDAVTLVTMGKKDKSYFYDLCEKVYGFSRSDADNLFDLLDYTPSVSELLRLSDLIPLDPNWVEDALKENGVQQIERRIIKDAIYKKQIRDEVNKAWSLMLDNFQWGLISEAELTEKLRQWYFGDTEIKIRIETANMVKTKLRVKLLRDAEIYLYRQGAISEDELLIRLVAIGISKDIANAIVRQEASKKGIEWEISE